jgi:two-component system, OmpR family, sensor histidine kinase SenX3
MIFRKPVAIEEQESELSELLLKALELLEDEVLIIDLDGRTIFQSPGIELLNILQDGKLQGDELLAIVRAVRRSDKPQRGTIEIARGPIGEGKRRVKIATTALDAEKILILISDESEKSRVDAIRRDFIANISHELKTPIGALSLLSEAILQARDEPEAMERFAHRIKAESKRLEDLVKEIIDLSRLQGDDPLRGAELVELGEVIAEAISQAETSAEARDIDIEFTLPKSGGDQCSVMGDREQLIMAVHNLIENAINYSPQRTRVAVELKCDGEIIEINVIDQGIGIPEKDLERIFERFYRVDPARSRESGGTGLGLSIVRHVIENHGGEVKVWSKVEVGSTFSLRLPKARGEESGT